MKKMNGRRRCHGAESARQRRADSLPGSFRRNLFIIKTCPVLRNGPPGHRHDLSPRRNDPSGHRHDLFPRHNGPFGHRHAMAAGAGTVAVPKKWLVGASNLA